MTRTSLLGFAFQSLVKLTDDTVARGKEYLMNWRLSSSLSSLPSSKLHVTTDGDNTRGAATDIIDSAVARNVIDLNGQKYSKEGTKAAHGTCCYDELFCFPRFDVLQSSPSDHHYLDIADQGSSHVKSWAKTVQKEWKILENDLPETIYMRVFEDRMDLLRVVMVGASGAPYHHGLFFFDLQLPPSYPAAPPQVYHHSFGLRLNPNLYESGTVCLSLLGTFGGEGSEVWSPSTSSILQVVVSIQGLVLNDQPYYNEAGYETLVGKPEGRRNALTYSKNASCSTFYATSGISRICKGSLPPSGEGCGVCSARATEAGGEHPCSAGLRLALANMVPSLVAAFMEIGAEGCEEFQELRVPLPCARGTTH
ncbi:hypothetical protein VPH35_041155 [Triticum aestivum]|uniref:Putative ubiquitin carrier protein E2 23 n=1 Tax=Aegilops tauschii TaxID=37682 RepID=M8BSU7_AEGTA|nr:probable ubiquitin-conjugating enzyme E2 23 [Triticum aestivum]